MRLQVEKGMLWAENLLVSSSVRKSFFIAVCPDSIASVIRQQSPSSDHIYISGYLLPDTGYFAFVFHVCCLLATS